MMNANHPPYTPNTNNNQLPSLPLNFSTIDYKTLGQATQYSAEAEAAKRIIQRLIEDYSRVFKTTKMIYDKEFGTLFNGLFVILKDILFAYGIGKGISRKLTTHQERKELVDKFLNLVFEKLSEEIPETEGAHNSSDLINSDQLSEETTEKKFINDFLKHIQHNFLTLQTDPNAVKTSIENRKNELQKAIGEKIKWIIEIILSYGFPTWSTPFIIAGAGGIYQLSKQIYEEKGVGNFGLPQTYQNLLGTFSVTKQFFFQAKPVNQLKEYLTTSFTKILNHEETKLRFDTIYDATTETNIQNNIILYQEILNLTHDVHEEFDSNSPVFFTYLHRLNLIEDLHTRLSGLLEKLSKV